jgi:hypothetical protein
MALALDIGLQDRNLKRRASPAKRRFLNLAAAYMNLNRLDEAEEVFKQAEQHGLSGEALLQDRYQLAFLKGTPPR